jgi:hypothetical protein
MILGWFLPAAGQLCRSGYPAGATGYPVAAGDPSLSCPALGPSFSGQAASEAAPLTAKSVGTPNGPCGFLSASSRRDSPVGGGRPSPSAAPNRAT